MIRKNIDLIFLQEVAQYHDEEVILENIKPSNYAYKLQQKLKEQNENYYLYFEPIKFSFNKYDEGLAILSRYKLDNIEGFHISKQKDYNSWKTRKILSTTYTKNQTKFQFITAHLGWSDEVETYENQFNELLNKLKHDHIAIIAGDFNVSPKSKEYSHILQSGLQDLYGLNPKHLFDPTHVADMDIHSGETRIDYVFSTHRLEVLERQILYKTNPVSDHYGVYVNLKF